MYIMCRHLILPWDDNRVLYISHNEVSKPLSLQCSNEKTVVTDFLLLASDLQDLHTVQYLPTLIVKGWVQGLTQLVVTTMSWCHITSPDKLHSTSFLTIYSLDTTVMACYYLHNWHEKYLITVLWGLLAKLWRQCTSWFRSLQEHYYVTTFLVPGTSLWREPSENILLHVVYSLKVPFTNWSKRCRKFIPGYTSPINTQTNTQSQTRAKRQCTVQVYPCPLVFIYRLLTSAGYWPQDEVIDCHTSDINYIQYMCPSRCACISTHVLAWVRNLSI